MWYVIQVFKGRESAMVEYVKRMVPASVLDECFSPRFETEIKVGGEWTRCVKTLLPGYIIAIATGPDKLSRHLYGTLEFVRLVKQGGRFWPLQEEERNLIARFTKKGSRTVPMSIAVKDGDNVIVKSGPLMGHEGLIKSIDRRKSIATLEVEICGRKVRTRVGLGVLTRDAWEAREAQAVMV
ncbi:NusG antitermination factor [Coriobacterium glomerans PW2]|uniref:NusG antitermination factor n=1 Tax=Coriobacterium glomerans (strain ATCC 49209 / DSM 20642 / JCM 10262 / PW2) TaxID=700015 RepID=F2N8B9_CORGP|nr:KOW motif-containing protein [Coriobacterium glomerans]AEB07302.1 NusG antitermination factor [Coriobacterium glomerans PW2]